MNLDGKDPQVEIELNETDEWCESQIVLFGQLTSYGEELYEATKEEVYDEKKGEWIYV